MKLHIYDDFMHFWPIFGIIHIHIHIHIKILLRFFAGNGVLISCADRALTVPRPVTKQIKKSRAAAWLRGSALTGCCLQIRSH